MGYLWDIFWISFGYLWDIFGTSSGYLLDIFGISFGYLWDMFGISLGYLCWSVPLEFLRSFCCLSCADLPEFSELFLVVLVSERRNVQEYLDFTYSSVDKHSSRSKIKQTDTKGNG